MAVALLCASCSGAGSTSDPSVPGAPAESAPDVQSILSAMRERYRGAKTYSDEGTFRGVIRPQSEHPNVTTARFRTRWIAPNRLRFELNEDATEFFPAKTLAIWTPRTGLTKRLFLGNIEDEESLDGALGALQGVAHGLTGLVPRWLLEGGCRCSGTYELRGAVACGASKCFQLDGTLRANHRVTLFISTTTSALVKYVSHSTVIPTPLTAEQLARLPADMRERLGARALEPFDTEDVIEFNPTFDGPIDESAFEVAPATD